MLQQQQLWASMWEEKAVCSRMLSRAWEAFIKMLIELTSWHISMGQDPLLLPFFSASICLPQSSVSLLHTTACLGIQPHFHIPLPRHSHFIWSLLSQTILYLPRVTKLRDASDKGRNHGIGTRRITSLAVCFVTDLLTGWKSDCHPSKPSRLLWFLFLQPPFSRSLTIFFLLVRFSPQTASKVAYEATAATKQETRETSSFTSKYLDWLHFHERHWMHCLYHFLLSHVFEYKSV